MRVPAQRHLRLRFCGAGVCARELALGRLSERDSAALHDASSNVKKLVELVSRVWIAVAPRKRWHVLGMQCAAEDIRRCADYGAGVEHRTNSGLYVVAEHCTEKLLLRIDQPARRPEVD